MGSYMGRRAQNRERIAIHPVVGLNLAQEQQQSRAYRAHNRAWEGTWEDTLVRLAARINVNPAEVEDAIEEMDEAEARQLMRGLEALEITTIEAMERSSAERRRTRQRTTTMVHPLATETSEDDEYPEEWEARINNLRCRFPAVSRENLIEALWQYDGHAGKASRTFLAANRLFNRGLVKEISICEDAEETEMVHETEQPWDEMFETKDVGEHLIAVKKKNALSSFDFYNKDRHQEYDLWHLTSTSQTLQQQSKKKKKKTKHAPNNPCCYVCLEPCTIRGTCACKAAVHPMCLMEIKNHEECTICRTKYGVTYM